MTDRTQQTHTPGPWHFQPHEDWSEWAGNIIGSYGKDARGVESIRTIDCITKYAAQEETAANARLIAAAPDLLAALESFCKETQPFIPRGGIYADAGLRKWVDAISPVVQKARATIARAKGE